MKLSAALIGLRRGYAEKWRFYTASGDPEMAAEALLSAVILTAVLRQLMPRKVKS